MRNASVSRNALRVMIARIVELGFARIICACLIPVSRVTSASGTFETNVKVADVAVNVSLESAGLENAYLIPVSRATSALETFERSVKVVAVAVNVSLESAGLENACLIPPVLSTSASHTFRGMMMTMMNEMIKMSLIAHISDLTA